VYQENKYIRSLIDNARRGKLVALEELFEINLVDIYTIIIRLTGDKALGELFTKKTLIAARSEINKKNLENISFEDWLRNIAIKTTLRGLIGNNNSKEKIQKKVLVNDNENENFSVDLLEKAIAELDDECRAIFVLNKVDGRPLATFSSFIGVSNQEAENKLSDSVSIISRSLSNIESEASLDTLIQSLPNEIQPDEKLLDSIIDEINELRIKELSKKELDEEQRQELRELERKRKESRRKNRATKKVVIKKGKGITVRDKITIGILLFISLVSFSLYLITSPNEWKLSLLSGKPLKNKVPIVEVEELIPGDMITTDELSSASINILDIGRINIFENTNFERLDSDNSCELIKGKLKVNTAGANDNLSIKIPDASIEDFYTGTSYSVEVDSKENSLISLEKGWLHVDSGNDEIIFPEKYNLKILNGKGAGLPYYAKCDIILLNLIEDYLFNGNENSTLDRILNFAAENEAIMLWNLLQRVKPDQRSAVYDKLNELVPHPDNITKKDMLSLDQEHLQIWLKEIRWYL